MWLLWWLSVHKGGFHLSNSFEKTNIFPPFSYSSLWASANENFLQSVIILLLLRFFFCSLSFELWQLITPFTFNQFLPYSQCSTCSEWPFPNFMLCYSTEHRCHVGPGGLRQSGSLHGSHQGTVSCQKTFLRPGNLKKTKNKTWTSVATSCLSGLP